MSQSESELPDGKRPSFACGTTPLAEAIPMDMGVPQRLGLTCVRPDGEEHRPAMPHRAILGSLERFIANYLEHTAGALPFWLAPVQGIVLPAVERREAYAREVVSELVREGIDVELDARSKTLGYRIRSEEMCKIPALVVVGDREERDRSVTVHRRGQREQRSLLLQDFTEL